MKSWKISLIVFVGIAALFLALQFGNSNKFADPDGFYHAKASQLLSQGQLHASFPWLAFTTWKDGYADQHYLYHWLMVPFNHINTLQWSIVAFALLFVIAFGWLFHKLNISTGWLWVLLMIIGSVDALFRFNLVKANTLSLAFLAGITWLVWVYQTGKEMSRYRLALLGLIVLSGLFVWTYGGFMFLPFFLLAYSLAVFLATRKIKILPLFAVILGIVIGIFTHPHSENFSQLIFDQFFRTGLGAGSQVPAGNEWLSFDLEWFFRSNALVILVFAIGIVLEIESFFRRRKLQWLNIWMYGSTIGLLALTLWHRRFVEYWVPFAVLSAAVTISPHLALASWQKFKQAWVEVWQFRFIIATLFVLIFLVANYNLQQVNSYLNNGVSADRYRISSEWLKDNSQPGDIVFNTQWDQFPYIFYWNDVNYQLVGLDPTFMYLSNKDLYWNWRKIADDNPDDWNNPEEVYKILHNDFKARYLFVDTDRNPDIAEFMRNHPKQYSESHQDNNFVIFEIK